MTKQNSLVGLGRPGYGALVAAFVAWKSFLLAVAATSALAPPYDSSGLLLVGPHPAARLTSWDAVYFVESSRRGYLYEQEWAFGAGLPYVVANICRALGFLGFPVSTPVVAICTTHTAHLLAILVLFRLGRLLWPGPVGFRSAFVAACLHIISPAGLFLSAPYAESGFALLSFAGHLIYVAAILRDPCWSADLLRLLAGLLYGLASTFRSNGLLNGIPFAWEALATALCFVRRPCPTTLRRLLCVGFGGLAVVAGTIGPQAVAYQQFCSGGLLRPWCTKMPPSIYAFVQEHYWNTGFLRYWTPSNTPLFLLAAPMLFVLALSARDVWVETSQTKQDAGGLVAGVPPALIPFVRCLAVAQLLLALLTLTSYHVQIVTRLSSGYPVWYWWLARGLAGGPRSVLAGRVVGFMIVYASIQAVLFSSFLPPA